jgi:hypothetical protein
MKSNQASTQDDDANEQKTTGAQSIPVPISKLRAAYHDADGQLTDAAEPFSASYDTVRRWMIDTGIHTPVTRENYERTPLLEDVDPDAVAGDGGRSA